jgi:hypothetical protein
VVTAALNRKACDPSIEAIRAKHYEMFRGVAGAESVAANSDSELEQLVVVRGQLIDFGLEQLIFIYL